MNNSAAKTIIFFSLHYPYHFSDSYLDEEFASLAGHFNKILIVSSNTFSEERRAAPPNAVVYRFNPHTRLFSLVNVFKLFLQPLFYKEIFQLFFTYRLSFSTALIKEVGAFYMRAWYTKAFLQKVIKEQDVDTSHLLIYSYWMIEGSMAAALLKKELPLVKVISRAHSLDVYFERSPVNYHPFRRFIYNQLDRLYFISKNAGNYFISKHSILQTEQDKIRISRIGISAERSFIPQDAADKLRIISVAYVQKLKRIDLIIDTLAKLDMPVEWVHVGHSNHNEQEFIDMQQYAKEKLRSKDNISFHFSGKTTKEDLFTLYAQQPFDVFLNVSETEGIPVSMMEAMSYSVPVIGTNVGGVAEIVEDGVNGFLLSAYPNAREVCAAIESFNALDGRKKNELRKNAFDTWNANYNAQINNEKFVAGVMSLLGQT